MRAGLTFTMAILAAAAPASALAAGFGTTEPLVDRRAPVVAPVSRVTASALSGPNRVRIYRTFTDGRATKIADVPSTRVIRSVHATQNPATDGLVTWTEDIGNQSAALAVFWPAGADGPNAARELLVGTGSGGSVFGILDPSRSATVVWQQAGLHQVTIADAGVAGPWPAPTDFGSGLADGASLPDGRAAVAIMDRLTIAGDPPAYQQLKVATRAAGLPFTAPVVVDGSAPPARGPSDANAVIGISPGGRAMIAYHTAPNYPLNGTPACQIGDVQLNVALGTVSDAGTAAFTTTRVSSVGADAVGDIKTPISGPDDRIATVWGELTGACNSANRPARSAAAYAAPGQGLTTIGVLPSVFGTFWWQADGQLYFTSTPAGGAQMGTPYDTGVALQGTTPPVVPPAVIPSTAVVPVTPGKPVTPVVVPTIRTQYRASPTGTVRLTATVPGTGVLTAELIARRSGLLAAVPKTMRVAIYKKTVTKAGTVTLTLKLKGRALKTLRQRGKLAITVRTTFRPTAGTAVTRSSAVMFRLKR